MTPRSAAPYFVLVSLVHAAASASLFPEVAAELPAHAPGWLLFAHGPLLVLSGYFEGQLSYEKSAVELPRWMAIAGPVRWAFTFALIYLTLVALKRWDVALAGLRPFGAPTWPVEMRAFFFVAMTAGMSFIYYLKASRFLVPLLRAIGAPARALPAPLGLPLALALGAALGLALLLAVSATPPAEWATVVDGLLAAPAKVVAWALGGLVGLALLGQTTLKPA